MFFINSFVALSYNSNTNNNTTMTNQEINTLATIVSRFTELNSAAKQAKNGIQDVRFKTFEGVLSQEDLTILEQAQRILEELSSNTNVHDAIKYHNKVTN